MFSRYWRQLEYELKPVVKKVAQERVPVAVAEVDREVDAVRVELRAERRDQCSILRVDRAHAAEALVVVRNLLEPLARDVPPAGHVLEERHHVVHPLRPAERDDEERVEIRVRESPACAVGRWLGHGLKLAERGGRRGPQRRRT